MTHVECVRARALRRVRARSRFASLPRKRDVSNIGEPYFYLSRLILLLHERARGIQSPRIVFREKKIPGATCGRPYIISFSVLGAITNRAVLNNRQHRYRAIVAIYSGVALKNVTRR